jgi:hypothetical protein
MSNFTRAYAILHTQHKLIIDKRIGMWKGLKVLEITVWRRGYAFRLHIEHLIYSKIIRVIT